jgi:putative ABC transport system permease protein
LGAALLSGREFNDADHASGVPVVLVNQRFASEKWPGEDPIGKRLRFFQGTTPEAWLTVVGVVSNIVQNDANRQEFGPVVYVPYRQNPSGGPWIFARTRVAPVTLSNAFRHEIQALDSDLPIYGPFSMVERLERFWDSRFYGTLFLIFAAIALLLASIGLYTVIAHSVSQRTQEIGIRMAIGASSQDILRLVVLQGMIPLGIGLAVGLGASLAVNQVLKSMLVQVSPYDPITLLVASAVLILSGTLGCWIPARRAIRVDPVDALRHE